MRLAAVILVSVAAAATVAAQDLDAALDRARQLVAEHRYQDVLALMSGFTDLDDPEARYAVAAETGRAHFHLGDYRAADVHFREAVSLRPRRTETALYLMATSYLLGDRPQALLILHALLTSGATDLYLAATLPGERTFLADPAVWVILDELAVPLEVDPDEGKLLGVRLGQPRSTVEPTLGSTSGAPGSALTARAGPYLTWAFGFDEADELSRVMLHNEHLFRYTPYRLQLGHDLDWRATPDKATACLGAPLRTFRDGDDVVIMEWLRGATRLTLEFATPRPPRPPGLEPDRPVLRVVRLERVRPAAADGGS